MALCLLPRAVRLQNIRLQCRTTSTLCRLCEPQTGSGSPQACKPKTGRSQALNKDSVCVAVIPYTWHEAPIATCLAKTRPAIEQNETVDVNSISVINLLSVLQKSSPMDLSTLMEYTKVVQKSATFQEKFVQSDFFRGCLTGRDLDTLFGIDKESEQVDLNETHHKVTDFEQLEHAVASYDSSADVYFREHNEINFNVKPDKAMDSISNQQSHDPCSNSDGFPSSNMASFYVQDTGPLFCMGVPQSPNPKPFPDNKNKPNLDELHLIQDHLNDFLPRCFLQAHNYRIYCPKVVFENNFTQKPFVTNGIKSYVMEMTKYRMYAHFRYANVRMNVIKSTVHEEDGTVRIRWRVSGIPQVRAFMFWKFLPWKYNKAKTTESEWMDGISTFYVQAKTGVVYKHRMDRVIPDEDVAPATAKTVPLNVSGAV